MMRTRDDAIRSVKFEDMNLHDPFFDSLRDSYDGFDDWMRRKADQKAQALMSFEEDGSISSMLYLKTENGRDDDTTPPLTLKRLKIGTFKVDFDHHTSIGNRLLAIALREFALSDCEYAYLTMYDTSNTQALKRRLSRYGFQHSASKGTEELWTKRRPSPSQTDPYKIFPFIRQAAGHDYLLAIWPEYHARMFGEVNLASEYGLPVSDTVPINSIEKIYLSSATNAPSLQRGDHIIPYRTGDRKGPAEYRSVVSGVCTVTAVKSINDFSSERDFVDYLRDRSVFLPQELHRFWTQKRYPYIISFLDNVPFKRYPKRKTLIEHKVITRDTRLVCEPISKQAFDQIRMMGGADEGYFVD